MSELVGGVNSSETLWTVDAVPDPEFGFYTVGSEIVQVIAGFPGGDPGYAVGQTFPSKIRVVRGTNGTTAATHADGSALTAANAFSGGGGGGIDVTDGTTTVTGATSLSLPAGTVSDAGGGVAGVVIPTLQATVTLTDAQIKALGTGTPFDIVDAPAAGKAIVPLTVHMRLNTTAGGYTNLAALPLRIQLSNRWGVPAPDYFMGDAGPCQIVQIGPGTFWNGSAIEANVTEGGNANDDVALPLQIIGESGDNNPFTGGNAGNSMIVTTVYVVIDVP